MCEAREGEGIWFVFGPSRCCLFLQRIDFERARADALDPQLRHKPRLIADEELPAWLLRDEEEVGYWGVELWEEGA